MSARGRLDDAQDADVPAIGGALFLAALWRARALCLTVVGGCLLVTFLYVTLIRQPLYEATATVGPVPNTTNAAPQGATAVIADLAGATGADPGATMLGKYRQILVSTRLADRLERDHGVMKALIPGWNEQSKKWELPPGIVPYSIDATKRLLGMPGWSPPTPATLSQYLSTVVSVDPIQSGDPLELHSQFYTVSVQNQDRDYAIKLLGWMLGEADAIVRQDELVRTRNRVAYLTDTLRTTDDIPLRDYLNQLMVGQEQTLMTLKADRQFAFDLVDVPSAPSKPAGFSNVVLLLLALMFGLLLDTAILFVLLQDRMSAYQASGTNPLADPFPNPLRQAWHAVFGPRPRKSRTAAGAVD